jgi:putative glycerol-1-phosphate prenyltransferase
MNIYNVILEKKKQSKKMLSLLIDPDKTSLIQIENICKLTQTHPIDFFFIGGSLLTNNTMPEILTLLKNQSNTPVVIFPGNNLQVHKEADAILFLSLISGRNAEMLIGKHIVAAPVIRGYGLETIPTGYLLINCGSTTTVEYMSNTVPIPYNKTDIAVCTAMAGEMLGLKMMYLEGGSGAQKPVSIEMISKVRENTTLPLIVGGGISNSSVAAEIYRAGADMIVVGSAIEKQPDLLTEFSEIAIRFS